MYKPARPSINKVAIYEQRIGALACCIVRCWRFRVVEVRLQTIIQHLMAPGHVLPASKQVLNHRVEAG